MTTAKKTQAELDTTQKELELTYEALRDLQSHTADAFEVSQTNIMEGTVALEDLTNQITVLCKEVDVYHRENKSLALQLRVEQEKNSGTKKFMDGIVKGYIKILSEKEGRSLLEMISLQDSEDKVTGSSASPRQKRVKAWLKETTQGKEKEESADLTTSTGQSDAEIGRGRPRTRDPIVTANTKV